MTTRKQALDALALLNPSPVFLEAYRSQRLPENLDIYFGCPEEFFLAPHTQAAYTGGRLVPVLDDGNFGVITFYDPVGGTLVQKDVESPSETLASFENWQQYLADLMIGVAGSIDDDDRLRRVSDLVGFRHFDKLMAFFDAGQGESADEFERRRAGFIGALGH